jgi:hypothetical protein
VHIIGRSTAASTAQGLNILTNWGAQRVFSMTEVSPDTQIVLLLCQNTSYSPMLWNVPQIIGMVDPVEGVWALDVSLVFPLSRHYWFVRLSHDAYQVKWRCILNIRIVYQWWMYGMYRIKLQSWCIKCEMNGITQCVWNPSVASTLLAQLKFEPKVSPVTLMSSTELNCNVSYMPATLCVSYIKFRTWVLASGVKFKQNLRWYKNI